MTVHQPVLTPARCKTQRAGLLACAALGAALLAGCAGQGSLAVRHSAPDAQAGAAMARGTVRVRLDGGGVRPVALAERAVAKAPDNVEARQALGHAYMDAGRFASAAATLEDAIALGDASPRTALGLAVSYIAIDRKDEALSLLRQWRDEMEPGDYGLALALAGETGEGVSVLADALAKGGNTPRVRQNLAYAYALDGRWREARIMAAQDVPADELDARITRWAVEAGPADHARRIATLVGAPLTADMGRPQVLALRAGGGTATVAAAPSAAETAPKAVASPSAVAAAPALQGELPPLDEGGPAAASAVPFAMAVPVPEPVVAPAEAVADRPAPPVRTATAPRKAITFISQPVIQDISRMVGGTARPPLAGAAPAGWSVGLGTFLSRAGADKAWSLQLARNPALAGHTLRVIETVEGGRAMFRVVVDGFDAAGARSLCEALDVQGETCLPLTTGKVR